MGLTTIWSRIRKYVPLWAYPVLSPVYRLRRERQLRQLETLDRAFAAANPGKAFPPADLRYNVIGPCTIEQFWTTGLETLSEVRAALREAGQDLDTVRDFLDFGCGCGRLAIAILESRMSLKYVGCDVDERAIDWCKDHLGGRSFLVNSELPPAPFPGASFDVVWCGSVFTHIDEAHQNEWLREMKRILRPGGVLLASVHGRESWVNRLPIWAVRDLEKMGFLYARTGADAGIHPDWYQVAWHTKDYVMKNWAALFQIRAYITQGVSRHQDIVVCQRAEDKNRA